MLREFPEPGTDWVPPGFDPGEVEIGTELDPWGRCKFVDAGQFVDLLDRWVPRQVQDERLNGLAETVQRWRRGAVKRGHFATVDRILIGLDRNLSEVPDAVWLGDDEADVR